jgi:hypothetical protein
MVYVVDEDMGADIAPGGFGGWMDGDVEVLITNVDTAHA